MNCDILAHNTGEAYDSIPKCSLQLDCIIMYSFGKLREENHQDTEMKPVVGIWYTGKWHQSGSGTNEYESAHTDN